MDSRSTVSDTTRQVTEMEGLASRIHSVLVNSQSIESRIAAACDRFKSLPRQVEPPAGKVAPETKQSHLPHIDRLLLGIEEAHSRAFAELDRLDTIG